MNTVLNFAFVTVVTLDFVYYVISAGIPINPYSSNTTLSTPSSTITQQTTTPAISTQQTTAPPTSNARTIATVVSATCSVLSLVLVVVIGLVIRVYKHRRRNIFTGCKTDSGYENFKITLADISYVNSLTFTVFVTEIDGRKRCSCKRCNVTSRAQFTDLSDDNIEGQTIEQIDMNVRPDLNKCCTVSIPHNWICGVFHFHVTAKVICCLKNTTKFTYTKPGTKVNTSMMNSMQGLGEKLKANYSEKRFNIVKRIPGENLELDLTNADDIMLIKFSTTVGQWNKKRLQFEPKHLSERTYIATKYHKIEHILDTMLFDNDQRLIQVMGNPGCGKSVLVRRLTTLWMADIGDWTQKCKLMFIVILRDITNTSAPLLDILKESTVCDPMMDNLLDNLMNTRSTAPHILVVIDGLDEKPVPEDSELYKFVTGRIYEHVNVVVTVRPKAEKLMNLSVDYRVTIYGTDTHSIQRYLKSLLSAASTHVPPNEKDVDDFIQSIKRRQIAFKMLENPLYLTLVGVLCNDYLAPKLSFTDAAVPNTVKELWCAILLVKLRIWFERLGRSDMPLFSMKCNPTSEQNDLDEDIKNKLLKFAKIIYQLLHDRTQNPEKGLQIPETRLEEFSIQIQDIEDSGLFESTKEKSGAHAYRCNYQLANYFANLHLEHHGRDSKWQMQRESETEFCD